MSNLGGLVVGKIIKEMEERQLRRSGKVGSNYKPCWKATNLLTLLNWTCDQETADKVAFVALCVIFVNKRMVYYSSNKLSSKSSSSKPKGSSDKIMPVLSA